MRTKNRPNVHSRALSRAHCGSVLTWLTWLLASLVTAALSHVLIGIGGDVWPGGDAYAEHDHASVAPVVLAAVGLGVILVLRSALKAIGRCEDIDPVVLLARQFGTMRSILPCIAVALGGFAALLAMEFSEQVAAFGYVEGVGDALGGNAVAGVAIVALVAAGVTLVGLRCARTLIAAAATAVGAVVAWIVAAAAVVVDRAAIVRLAPNRRRRLPNAVLARCSGLRAPPLAGR